VIGDGESENRFPIVAHVATANGKARLGTLIVSGYVGEVTVLGKTSEKPSEIRFVATEKVGTE
jgi:hypothetical protein